MIVAQIQNSVRIPHYFPSVMSLSVVRMGVLCTYSLQIAI